MCLCLGKSSPTAGNKSSGCKTACSMAALVAWDDLTQQWTIEPCGVTSGFLFLAGLFQSWAPAN